MRVRNVRVNLTQTVLGIAMVIPMNVRHVKMTVIADHLLDRIAHLEDAYRVLQTNIARMKMNVSLCVYLVTYAVIVTALLIALIRLKSV